MFATIRAVTRGPSLLLMATLAACLPAWSQLRDTTRDYFGTFLRHSIVIPNTSGQILTSPSAGIDWQHSGGDGPGITGGRLVLGFPNPPPLARWSRQQLGSVNTTVWTPAGGMPVSIAVTGSLKVASISTSSAAGPYKLTLKAWAGGGAGGTERCGYTEQVQMNVGKDATVGFSITAACSLPYLSSTGDFGFQGSGSAHFSLELTREFAPFGTEFGSGVSVDYRYQFGLPAIVLNNTTSSPASRITLENETARTVELRNAVLGVGPLEWQAAGAADGASGNWLRFNPSSGTLANGQAVQINLSADARALAPADYNGELTITGRNAANSPMRLPLLLRVTQEACPTPASAAKGNRAERCADELKLANPQPAANVRLTRGTEQEISVDVDFALLARNDARLLLRVLDQDGAVQVSTTPRAVTRSTNRVNLKTPVFEVPPTATTLILRAAFADSATGLIFLESDPIFFEVVASPDKISFQAGSIKPDPANALASGQRQAFEAGVIYTLASRPDAWIALRLFDAPSGGTLVRSSDFELEVVRRATDVARTLSIAGFELPKDGKPIYLVAVLIDRLTQRVLTRTAAVKFEVKPPPDLSISSIEVVQVVQNQDNTIPLIQYKPAVVRVFVKQTGEPDNPIAGVTGTLRAFRTGGGELPGTPNLLNASVLGRENPDRNNETHSLNFLVPPEWTEGMVTFRAEIKAPPSRPEGPEENHRKEVAVKFSITDNAVTPFTAPYLPLCYLRPDNCPTASIGAYKDLLEKIYPSGPGGLRYLELPIPSDSQWDVRLNSYAAGTALLSRLREIYHLLVDESGLALDQLVAWLPDDAQAFAKGQADARFTKGEGKVAWVMEVNPRTSAHLLAHEIGHNLNLRHTNTSDECLNPALDSKTDWKLPDGTIQEPGYDPAQRRFVPRGRFDLMTYCEADRIWISPFHYQKLVNELSLFFRPNLAGEGTPGAASSPKPHAEPAEYALVGGMARRDGSATGLKPVYRLTSTRPGQPSDPEGNHCLRFTGAAGTLADHCFTLLFESENGEPVDEQTFSVKAPFPAGVTRLALMRGEQELAALSVGAGPPAATIQSPQGGDRWEGRRTILWSAIDPGGGALVYTVQYSFDNGGAWLPLAIGLQLAELAVDTGQIQGGAQVHFRVTASNGLEVSRASVGPVEVIQNPRLEAVPARLDYGNVTLGQAPELNLTLRNGGSGLLNITGISSDHAAFEFPPEAPFFLRAGGQRALAIRFRPQATGVQRGTLTIRSGDRSRPDAMVELAGAAFDRLVPNIEASPTLLDFGGVAVGQGANLALAIRNTGQAPLNVTAIAFSNNQFSAVSPAAPFTVTAGSRQDLTVRFRPTAAGVQSGRLTVTSNDPARMNVEIAVRGSGLAAAGPSIDVTPASLDFGNVTVGQSAERTLTIRNSGAGALLVNSIASSHPRFIYAGPAPPFSLAASAQQLVPIRFSPIDFGAQSATLAIAGNDPNSPTFNVALTGTGAAPSTGSNPTPAITQMLPVSAPAGAPGFQLTVFGSSFVNTSVVQWNDSNRPTTFISATELRATTVAADTAAAGTAKVNVSSPVPGGGRSGTLDFTVSATAPGAAIHQFDLRACPIVSAFVGATDRQGNGLAGLGTPNFQCFEDGQTARCTVEPAANVTNLSVMFVIDTNSALGQGEIDLQKGAIKLAADVLGPLARVAVVQLDGQALPAMGFNAPKESLGVALDGLITVSTGGAALYDALDMAIRITTAEAGCRRAIVLLTSTGNTAGAIRDPNRILLSARAAGIPIFAFPFVGAPSNTALLSFLNQASLEGGGRLYPDPSAGLALLVQRQATILANHYVVTYTTPRLDGKSHTLGVTVTSQEGTASAAARSYARCEQQ